MFGKREDAARKDTRNVNVTPGLQNSPPAPRGAAAEPPKSEQPSESPRISGPADDTPGSKLIVGPDIKLKGVEITDCDTLVVEGRVEAAMDSRVIKIAEHGVFSGKVGIDVAEIRGRFEGELTARKHLIIHATGRVSGTIRYGKITIEEGGELSGDVATIAGAPGVQLSKGASPAATAPADIMSAYDPFAHKAKALSGKSSMM